MKVILAETAGFCYGVERAVNLARETAKARGGAMLGSIVHNAGVVREIEDLGMRLITSPDQAKAGETVLIRAHGEPRATLDALRERGAEVVSAVCPHVERIRKLAQEAEHEGRRVILIGERHHPEVQGIAGWCSDPLIFENVQEAQKYLQEHPDFAHLPSIMLAQTTCIRALWESCVKFLKKQCTNLKINDTICNATQKRQTEAAELSAKVDAMVVVGDRRSANTRHLTEICRENCGKVLQIESADELSPEFFSGCRVAGLTAGASTPASIIMEVLTTMTEENINTTAPETSESFEELLEKSFKTLNTGDKVTGIVTAIGTTEIQVDVGCKQAGYIPVSELSSDPDVKPEDVVKVGDEIEAYVVRVNDVEGYATLSKKRLDAVKLWEDIETAVEDKTVLEGTVTEVNKGGIVVSVKGVRVFVPASQSGMPKDSDLGQMVKQKVKLRVTEVNRARRRVVGSIKSVLNEERQAAQAAIWEGIEVGKHYDGVVKSMTSYGVFVDIGGVDGMVHISELSWSRIKHPSEVVKVGDTVDFTVAADVPHAAAGWDAYPFTITDTASKGLQIAAKSAFTVQFGDHTTVDPDLYTITQEGNAQSGTTTTIYFADATTLAGRTIVVSYQGTVTKDALDGLSGSGDNKATITTKDGTSGEGKTVLKTYGFQFTKIGKEGNEAKPLAGAKFVVKNAEGKFLKQAEDGAWSFVSDQNDAKTFTTENDGLVKVAGLAAGTYTVVETQAPTGYAQNFRVTFNVEITDEGLVTFEPDALRQVQPVDNTTANATATVLNVKSVTQLPLTGAAGTVLFTVVALLVGGAGVAVAVKSRRRTY